MDNTLKQEINKLTNHYFRVALKHIDGNTIVNEKLKKAFSNQFVNEEAELPGYENRTIKFGKFENREFVIMMIDIRKSTEIINSENGFIHMFLIFYIYAGITAKIVDFHNGSTTEFLGDGVLNIFDTKTDGLQSALMKSMEASWDILEARETILNPFLEEHGLSPIDMGIGIDHGVTIVTQFGYRGDTDLKAFGKCVYNASKLSKGINEIFVSENSQSRWPQGTGGLLRFGNSFYTEGNSIGFTTYKVTNNGQ